MKRCLHQWLPFTEMRGPQQNRQMTRDKSKARQAQRKPVEEQRRPAQTQRQQRCGNWLIVALESIKSLGISASDVDKESHRVLTGHGGQTRSNGGLDFQGAFRIAPTEHR